MSIIMSIPLFLSYNIKNLAFPFRKVFSRMPVKKIAKCSQYGKTLMYGGLGNSNLQHGSLSSMPRIGLVLRKLILYNAIRYTSDK